MTVKSLPQRSVLLLHYSILLMRLSIQTGGGSQCAGAHLSRRGRPLQLSATPESACRRVAVARATPPRSSARAPLRQDDADSLLEEFSLLDELFGGAEPHASMADAGVEEGGSAYDEGQEDGQHPEASSSDSHSTARESPVLPQRQALGRSAARPWERAVPQAQQLPTVQPAPPGLLQSRRNGSKSSSSGVGAPVQPLKLARQTPRLTLKARPLESAVAPTEAVGAADPIAAGQRPSHPPAAAAAIASPSAAAEPDGVKLRPRPQLPTLMGKLNRETTAGTASSAGTRSGLDALATSRRQASGAGGTAAGVGRGPGDVAQQQSRSETAARGEEETAAAAAAAAAAWFAQDPVFQAAEAAAAAGRRSLPAEVDSVGTASSSSGSNDAWPSHLLERSSMTAGYSRVADLLEPLPLLELQPPTDMPPPWQAQPWLERPAATTNLSSSSSAPASSSSLPGMANSAPLVTTSRGSSGAQFVPSTRVSRRKRVEPSASTQLQAALAREIAAVTKPPSQRQAERAAGPNRGGGSAGPAPLLMRQVTPETLPGGLSSGGQLPDVSELPAEVDATSWRLHARVRFPKARAGEGWAPAGRGSAMGLAVGLGLCGKCEGGASS